MRVTENGTAIEAAHPFKANKAGRSVTEASIQRHSEIGQSRSGAEFDVTRRRRAGCRGAKPGIKMPG